MADNLEVIDSVGDSAVICRAVTAFEPRRQLLDLHYDHRPTSFMYPLFSLYVCIETDSSVE